MCIYYFYNYGERFMKLYVIAIAIFTMTSFLFSPNFCYSDPGFLETAQKVAGTIGAGAEATRATVKKIAKERVDARSREASANMKCNIILVELILNKNLCQKLEVAHGSLYTNKRKRTSTHL